MIATTAAGCSPSGSVVGLLLALSLLVSCTPSVSKTPLSNARPEGPETYYYGTADQGGKQLESAEPKAEQKPLELPKPPALVRRSPANDEKPKADEAKPNEANAAVTDAGGGSKPLDIAGRYLGTDTVVIAFPGMPEEPQVDDKAIVDVVKLADDNYELTVVASNNGEALCTIEGKLREATLQFEPGQSCFSGILGFEMDTTLGGGTAVFTGEAIHVMFDVALVLDAPGGALEGSVDYDFEGKKER